MRAGQLAASEETRAVRRINRECRTMSVEQPHPTTDNGSPGHTRLLAAVFCPSCRVSFYPKELQRTCPKCGQAYAATAPDASTATFIPEQRNMASCADEVDRLIGKNLGIYRLEALLGAGAMGRVYLARHLDLERSCALKILPPRMADSDPGFVERFMNEGRAAARLVHPNVITVHAIGMEDGFHYLEMEFVTGQSLQRLLEEDGAPTPERATALTARVADGLAAAHQLGILHRDLKPDNVLLTHTGIPKIADFGLARSVAWDDGSGLQELVGTPAFMAPELFQGLPASPASDVYALGVLYYTLLTGRHPYTAPNLNDLIRQVTQEPLPEPKRWCPKLPLEVAECLHLMVAKAPSNRPKDGVGAAMLLQAVLGQVEDLESLIQKAFPNHPGLKWARDGQRFILDLNFANGRHQRVLIEPSQHAAAERLLIIQSICAKAEPAYFETALRLNSEILHGALALREIDGQSVFVMLDSYPRATVDAEEIRRSVLEVAHRADAVERLLSDVDRH
jgi:serine/threonine protein kinase